MKKIMVIILSVIAIYISLFSALGVTYALKGNGSKKKPLVKIGYFHGGRVNMIYRTYIYDFFKKERVRVILYARNLRGNTIFKVSKKHATNTKTINEIGSEHFGKITGVEIVERMIKGEFDAGTIGESSFVYMVNNGAPIVAVAMLGHDTIENPGKGILIRKGLTINSPQDFKNTTLISRRAGPGNAIFLREFLKDIGMLGDPSIKIIDGVFEDEVGVLIAEGKIDGGLYHFKALIELVEKDMAVFYRPMNWMNPELSHAILAFNKDFVEEHPELVQKVVIAYLRRVFFEKKLPEESLDTSRDKGMMMKLKFRGMSIPQYDFPPLVRFDLLNYMQDLLVEYGNIEKGINLEDFVDNSFVENAYNQIIREEQLNEE